MPPLSPNRELGFLVSDLSRTIRTYVDREARRFGMTRAQWAVLVRVQRSEGLKQNELAGLLDLQPITLTRLIDRLGENGLIERRNDPNDRRAKRLFLTPAAQPVLDKMAKVSEEMMATALRGTDPGAIAQMTAQLSLLKDNLREAIQARSASDEQERRYG
jgi:MarR family transcriptional regulator for hemolysin